MHGSGAGRQRIHQRVFAAVRGEHADVIFHAARIDVRRGLDDGAAGTVDPGRVAQVQHAYRLCAHAGLRVGSHNSWRTPAIHNASALAAAAFTSRKNAAMRASDRRPMLPGASKAPAASA